jgi:hypothetical protein
LKEKNHTKESLKIIVRKKSIFDRQLKIMIDNFSNIVREKVDEGASEDAVIEDTITGRNGNMKSFYNF